MYTELILLYTLDQRDEQQRQETFMLLACEIEINFFNSTLMDDISSSGIVQFRLNVITQSDQLFFDQAQRRNELK